MATDEGVLGRTAGLNFARDGGGRLPREAAENLYDIHRYEKGQTQVHLVFRDHTISDLVGFVYSGMPPQDAANHLMSNIKQAAQPVLDRGQDAVVSIILDGENAWEYYPRSGRELLRRFYDALQRDPNVEAVTVSEAISRHKNFTNLTSLVPGSWINANFNIWIGAPEDNRSWDYLYHAREFYSQSAARASEAQRELAFEEILIAEGSDWNWWYGPEHHSANDREFDELYRKHLSNVYQALGARRTVRLHNVITSRKIAVWKVSAPEEEGHLASSDSPSTEATTALARNFEFKLPLAWLLATPVGLSNHNIAARVSSPVAIRLRLRFSIWQNGLPMDALPVEGWMELQLLSEENLMALGR